MRRPWWSFSERAAQMNLDNIVVVLDHPDESRNVGSVCRAMANCGISELRIVGKRSDYDADKVHVLAVHAAEIFDSAVFFDSINSATEDCVISAGTTRRRGKKRKEKLFLPEEFALQAASVTGTAENPGGKAAVVFGNERTGLTDVQLKECTVGVTIPSSAEFGSLNLSHAVQIICYHLFRENGGKITGYTPIPLGRIDRTVNVIADSLQKVGFFTLAGRGDMELFWRSLLSRASMSESEAQYIEKMFTKMANLATK